MRFARVLDVKARNTIDTMPQEKRALEKSHDTETGCNLPPELRARHEVPPLMLPPIAGFRTTPAYGRWIRVYCRCGDVPASDLDLIENAFVALYVTRLQDESGVYINLGPFIDTVEQDARASEERFKHDPERFAHHIAVQRFAAKSMALVVTELYRRSFIEVF
jgi:hypothetical protein